VRYLGPSCRQCRREGTKLFLKGTKCFTEKCPVERRPYAPGQHGQNTARRRKSSEYAKQLREKQKIKRIYGVSERQFRNTFQRVVSLPGITGHELLASLESRLDNMVYRMGFASSRKAARQLIRHRHVEVNQKTVDIPSYLVRPGQEVRVRPKSREQVSILTAMDQSSRGAPLSWLALGRTFRSTRKSSSSSNCIRSSAVGTLTPVRAYRALGAG
jgi:small subunit ribosomal protein S4